MKINCGCNKALAGMRGLRGCGMGDAVMTNPPKGTTVYPTLLLNLNTGVSENKNLVLIGSPPNAIYKDIANGNAVVSNVQMANQYTTPQGPATWYDPTQPLAPGMTTSGPINLPSTNMTTPIPISTAQTCTTPACIAAASQLTPTLATGGNTVGGGNPGAVSTSDIMLGTVDVTTLFSMYGIWIAAGVAALFLLNRK